MRRYLRTFVNTLSPSSLPLFDANAISPLSPRHHPLPRHTLSVPGHHQSWFSVVFSFNPELSPIGAAAVIAACLLIPRRLSVELDFRLCAKLTSITLRPWLSLLRVERFRASGETACANIIGLCIDGCPFRTFDLVTFRTLNCLSWISLRSTELSNLWRTAELLQAVPSLRAVLVSGDLSDNGRLEQMKTLCRTPPTSSCDRLASTSSSSLDRELSVSPVSRWTQVSGHPPLLEHLLNQQKETVSSMPTETDLLQLSPPTHSPSNSIYTSSIASDPRQTHLAADPQLSLFSLRMVTTPVSRVPYFRAFMLGGTSNHLEMFDGACVTADCRQKAKAKFQSYFERPPSLHGMSKASSITDLLKNREVGLSRPAFSQVPHCWKDPPPRKRRRTTDFSVVSTDLMAAVAVAGFPTAQHALKLSPSASITVALAAASSAANHPDEVLRSSIHRLEEAALPIRNSVDDISRSARAPESWQTKGGVPSHSPIAQRQKFLMSGFGIYHGSDFTSTFCSALINRCGPPRVEYLRPGGDRPRQFEYNPANPNELVYGTEHGYLVVMDQETGEVKGSCRSGGGMGNRGSGEIIGRTASLNELSDNCRSSPHGRAAVQSAPVFGLSWLNKRSNLFLSGRNDGAIHVYNVDWMRRGYKGGCKYACDSFDNLTSIHVSSDDVRFAVSGASHDVGLFDLETGRRIETMRNCHAREINVIKFAHNSPHVLLTSSFDRCVRKWDLRESRPGGGRRPIFTTRSRTDNVMACFSPDDQYLLVSAVDNEVTQYSACDGRLDQEFRIPKTNWEFNFTRSYYMNDRDYIVTGSCMESVVRIFNARTGALFGEVDMDGRERISGTRVGVQSLRANPWRKFNFSALLVLQDNLVNQVIANVDMHTR